MPRLLELFSGTGSVGHAFQRAGWDVVSVDIDPKSGATHCVDILDWECPYPPGYFDAVHASPPCQHYSRARTTAKTPRNLELADACAKKALELIEYLQPKWWTMENPQTGLLKTRPFMDGIPYVDVCYCVFGAPFRKRTRLWGRHNLAPRPCPGRNKCSQMVGTRHLKSAQRGPSGGRKDDRFRLEELYQLPPSLCDAMVAACA
jgi:hypothetical protein